MTERLLQNLKSTNMLFAIDFEKKKFHRTKRDRTIELYQLQAPLRRSYRSDNSLEGNFITA